MCIFCPGTIDSQPVNLCRKCGCCRRHCECYGQGERLASVTVHAIAKLEPGPNAKWLQDLNVPNTENNNG